MVSLWSAKRRSNAAYYDRAFADVPEIRTPFVDPANESIYNQYTIRTDRRDGLQSFLKERGIGTAIYYPLPLHLQPCFEYLGYKKGMFPIAESLADQFLSLPMFPELTKEQIEYVVRCVTEAVGAEALV